MACLAYAAFTLWNLGYPDQALKRGYEALTLARELAHPQSLALALYQTAGVYWSCGEWQAVQKRIEAAMILSHEQGLPYWLTMGTILQGLVLAKQGQKEEGISQMRQGASHFAGHGSRGATNDFSGLASRGI